MTTESQFRAGARLRHDYSDMIQVRYPHPTGEDFDTWISGEEVMARLQTAARERLIRSFSTKNWRQARASLQEELEKGREQAGDSLRRRLAGAVSDALGDHVFGDTLADKVRGVDSPADPHAAEKAMWHSRLQDAEFRDVALTLAWINLRGTMPDEALPPAPDDWV